MEKIIQCNGVDLCVETFGDAADPTILLIAGAASSMDWWEVPFCRRLAAGGRHVIRYDFRDTGRSAHDPVGAPTYTGHDLTLDAVAILDALDVQTAHLVGISMGGGIAQVIATLFPERVSSLTLISTTPDGPLAEESELPSMSEDLKAIFSEPAPEPDWSDRDAVISNLVEGLRPFAGSGPFDEDRFRALAGQIFDRTADVAASQTNHWILEGGDAPTIRLVDITVPALVIHGADDPLLPLPHGQALAQAIPGARLLTLEGVGHEFPPPWTYDVVIPAIAELTALGEEGAEVHS